MPERISRRTFIKGLGVLGLAGPAVLSGCAQLNLGGGGGGDVQIAGINPLSGSNAQLGQDGEKAIHLAIDEVGSILGHPIKFVSLDSQSNVDHAVRLVGEAMSSNGVKYFVGEALSSVALAESAEINRRGGFFFTSVGADEITGTQCKKTTFRWSVSTYGAIHETVLPMLKADKSLKRWYSITPDYVFGTSLLKNAKDVLQANGAELIGNETHSLAETEFSSYISKALAANPDVLLLLNFADQSAKTLRQAVSFGAKQKTKILIAWWDGLTAAQGLGSEIVDGVYFGCQYWHTIDSPLNKHFVDLMQKKYQTAPNYPEAAPYIETKLILDGMKKANSVETKDVIAALEGYEYDGLTGKERIRAEDHQTIKNYYLLKGKSKDKMKDQYDFVDIVSFGNSVIPVDQTGCKFTS